MGFIEVGLSSDGRGGIYSYAICDHRGGRHLKRGTMIKGKLFNSFVTTTGLAKALTMSVTEMRL